MLQLAVVTYTTGTDVHCEQQTATSDVTKNSNLIAMFENYSISLICSFTSFTSSMHSNG